MIAYLDDWLVFGPKLPAQQIVQTITDMGITINHRNSILQPTSGLIYLGLRLDAHQQQLRANPRCIQNLLELLTTVSQADKIVLKFIMLNFVDACLRICAW
jgi:hypothetical protein